jgi:CheY-like chemotaxis protein
VTLEPIDILLVEDDPDLRDAMTDVLERGGHRTKAASNGLEALEWLQETARPPALILLDLMMPVMDGWQFREEQLKDPRLAPIQVAVLSARSDALDAGVTHLRKPIQAKALLAFVARHCGPPGE